MDRLIPKQPGYPPPKHLRVEQAAAEAKHKAWEEAAAAKTTVAHAKRSTGKLDSDNAEPWFKHVKIKKAEGNQQVAEANQQTSNIDWLWMKGALKQIAKGMVSDLSSSMILARARCLLEEDNDRFRRLGDPIVKEWAEGLVPRLPSEWVELIGALWAMQHMRTKDMERSAEHTSGITSATPQTMGPQPCNNPLSSGRGT